MWLSAAMRRTKRDTHAEDQCLDGLKSGWHQQGKIRKGCLEVIPASVVVLEQLGGLGVCCRHGLLHEEIG